MGYQENRKQKSKCFDTYRPSNAKHKALPQPSSLKKIQSLSDEHWGLSNLIPCFSDKTLNTYFKQMDNTFTCYFSKSNQYYTLNKTASK